MNQDTAPFLFGEGNVLEVSKHAVLCQHHISFSWRHYQKPIAPSPRLGNTYQ